MWLELKYASRSLRQAPSFSLLVILTLGLGIGTTTAFISVVNGVLLSPLPHADADRLVVMWQRSPGANVEEDTLSPPQFQDILEQSTVFEELAMMSGGPILLNREGPAEASGFLWVSSSFLHMIGAKPHLGRILTEEDDLPGAPFVFVLTHELWERRYGSDPDIIGKTIGTETSEVEVVGVLEPGLLLDTEVFPNFFFSGNFDMVLSMPLSEEQRADRGRELYHIVGKLKRGVSEAEAQAQLDVIAARMLRENPPKIHDESFTIDVVPLLDQVVGRVRTGLWLLLASAGVLLLVACMNVANLILARAGSRQMDLGIRAALGAGRGRLVARLLSESVLLSSLGALSGFGLAWLFIETLTRMGPVNLPRLENVVIDGLTLTAAMALAVCTSLLAGAVPAWRLGNVDPKEIMADTLRVKRVLRKRIDAPTTFVMGQIALAFVLLVGAGLISRSFVAFLEVDPGFEPTGTLSVRVLQRLDNDRPPAGLLEPIRELPGIRAAAIGSSLPFAPGAAWWPIEVEGHEAAPGDPAAIADRRFISPDYFDVMGIPSSPAEHSTSVIWRRMPRRSVSSTELSPRNSGRATIRSGSAFARPNRRESLEIVLSRPWSA